MCRPPDGTGAQWVRGLAAGRPLTLTHFANQRRLSAGRASTFSAGLSKIRLVELDIVIDPGFDCVLSERGRRRVIAGVGGLM